MPDTSHEVIEKVTRTETLLEEHIKDDTRRFDQIYKRFDATDEKLDKVAVNQDRFMTMMRTVSWVGGSIFTLLVVWPKIEPTVLRILSSI